MKREIDEKRKEIKKKKKDAEAKDACGDRCKSKSLKEGLRGCCKRKKAAKAAEELTSKKDAKAAKKEEKQASNKSVKGEEKQAEKLTSKKEAKKAARKADKKKRKLKMGREIGTAAALTGAALACTYQFCFGRTEMGYRQSLRTRSDEFNEARADGAARLALMPCEEYVIESARGVELKGYYYQCGDKPTGKIAFLLHGRHTEHLEAVALYYEYYHKKGFDVFACDHTGAGESGGNITGFGMFESTDCLMWLDFLQDNYGDDIQVILHGFSMGASTALKICDYCPDFVKFIVSDSAYTDIASILKSKTKLLYHPLRLINRIVAGYDISDMQVKSAVACSDMPILFVHGKDDSVVPFEMAEELYELHAGDKDSLFMEGAGHVEVMYKDPAAYEAKLDEFIAKYIK